MKTIVICSGGLDSVSLAHMVAAERELLRLVSFDYGQRHRKELDFAAACARRLGVPHDLIDLRGIGAALTGSALTDDIDVPKTGVEEGIPVTYVPARNLVFLSLTLAWAEAIGAHDIFIGVNALDYSGYPDCRPDFIASFQETARLATRDGVEGRPFTIHAPLQHWGKARIASEAQRLGLDPAMSWSCYDPAEDGRACGLCDSCRLRQKGFEEAGLVDPTPYAALPDEA